MTKLNDLQLILLSHAANTEDGSVLPLPEAANDQARAHKELQVLLRRGLVSEAETNNAIARWRQDGDIHFGLTITDAGKSAINLGGDEGESGDGVADAPATCTAQREPRSSSKIANVLALLGRAQGATLADLVEATGWQQHTTRAALTGLKKKGHVIGKTKRGDITCYHVARDC